MSITPLGSRRVDGRSTRPLRRVTASSAVCKNLYQNFRNLVQDHLTVHKAMLWSCIIVSVRLLYGSRPTPPWNIGIQCSRNLKQLRDCAGASCKFESPNCRPVTAFLPFIIHISSTTQPRALALLPTPLVSGLGGAAPADLKRRYVVSNEAIFSISLF